MLHTVRARVPVEISKMVMRSAGLRRTYWSEVHYCGDYSSHSSLFQETRLKAQLISSLCREVPGSVSRLHLPVLDVDRQVFLHSTKRGGVLSFPDLQVSPSAYGKLLDTLRACRILGRGTKSLAQSLEPVKLVPMPNLDLTVPLKVVRSTTRGHYHVFLDVPLIWSRYRALLNSLQDAGIIDKNFYDLSCKRQMSMVVRPGLKRKPRDRVIYTHDM